ncbi:ribulose-phosphate 3-epimerase [Mycoplasma corogypsi]|uniref:ribulose-phosphate 3-epimerase n=1 Tax=Mycoplasma corogypsi TaxID=2106 RepID=UPI003873A387
MSTSKYVTPSILNVKKEDRLEMVNKLVQAGIKWIHYDIMDGQFVPNTTIEPEEIAVIDKESKPHFKDAHLMIKNPYEYIEKVIDYFDIFTFHYEAIEDDLDAFYQYLTVVNRDRILKIGLAIKPNTPVSAIVKFLPFIDLVLVMSVEPGLGGQKFMPIALDKIKELRKLRTQHKLFYLIQVDGGINEVYGPQCFQAGADACVAGTYLIVDPTKERINTILGKYAKLNNE